ncbi:hypothetical protein NDU88_000153 [Pleurodeles waltl]|uniref:Uncharacterized protein n=1 Tax=Pleurodeles waltl TaxID=8319 RepID=A0AAV7P7I9_PLEWA|nr:hypothetical protein NDU88_000153 [Pleurodeles waltl]
MAGGLSHKPSPHQEPPGAGDELRSSQEQETDSGVDSWGPQPQTKPTSGAPRRRRRPLVWTAGGLSHKPSPHQEPPGEGDGLWCEWLVASATNQAHIRSHQEQETDSGVDGWRPQPQTEPTSGAPQPQTEPTSGAPRRRRTLVWTAGGLSHKQRPHQEPPGAGDGLSHKLNPHQELQGVGDGLWCGRLVASATNQAHIWSPQEKETASGVDGWWPQPQTEPTSGAPRRRRRTLVWSRSPQKQETDSGVDGWRTQPQTEPTSGAPRSRRQTQVWTAGGLSHKPSPHQEPPGEGDGLCVDGWWPQPQTEPTSGAPQPQTEPTSGAPRRRRTLVWMAGGLSHKQRPHQEPPGAGDGLSHKLSPHQEPPGAGDRLSHKRSPHQEPQGVGDGLWCGRLVASATNRAHIKSPQEQETESATNRAHIRNPQEQETDSGVDS